MPPDDLELLETPFVQRPGPLKSYDSGSHLKSVLNVVRVKTFCLLQKPQEVMQ